MALTDRLMLAQFLLWPEAQPAREFERGVVRQKMSPKSRHGRHQAPGLGLGTQQDRCRWHVAHGVAVSLLVDPRRKAIWVFRTNRESGPLRGTDLVDLGDVAPGLSFAADDVFAVLRGRPSF